MKGKTPARRSNSKAKSNAKPKVPLARKSATQATKPAEPASVLWIHPHLPACVAKSPHALHVYQLDRAQSDPSLWKNVATVRLLVESGRPIRIDPAEAARLTKWGAVADPRLQRYGMGDPFLFYADFSRNCRKCGAAFVFSASAQRAQYETRKVFIDAVAVDCGKCRAALRRKNHAVVAFDESLQRATREPGSVDAHLKLVECVLELAHTGWQTRNAKTKARTSLNKAEQLGARTRTIQALRARLDALARATFLAASSLPCRD